ncbi:alpha/beta fold hydrolase [Quadrisphaera oryzae]|uniref:alpha/beta fold hydrolase n=1 Tax=Quadrisphaera TaxID=317661 RepID=UPI001C97D803
MPDQYFDLGDLPLASGHVLPGARLAYQTAGTLNDSRSNAVLLPHMYSGTADFMHAFIGEGRPLDPRRYFFVLPAQLGSGTSSSPSTTPPPYDRGAFPPVAISDDVRAQHRLLTDHLGISRLAMVSGWSMGGQQTLEWAVRYPDLVERAVPFAATLRNPDHCTVFCQLHTDALRSDPAWNGGFYERASDVHVGLRRHAQAFALMGASSHMYRQEAWRELGFTSRDGFVQGFLQAYFLPMDPNDLLCQAHKWATSDVSADHGGDLDAAAARITARVTDVAFTGDLFFPPEDVRADAERIPGARYEEIGSVWGHFTMFNLREADTAQIDAVYAEALAS